MDDLLACPECHETGVVDYRGAAAKCPTCKGAKRIADRRSGKDRRATPSAEQKVGLWMPIETAPKDGTTILMAFESSGVAITGSWSRGWTPTGSRQNDLMPTHWQPLPAPPATPTNAFTT